MRFPAANPNRNDSMLAVACVRCIGPVEASVRKGESTIPVAAKSRRSIGPSSYAPGFSLARTAVTRHERKGWATTLARRRYLRNLSEVTELF